MAFSSCRQEEASPIRNIKAGPNLLRAQAAGSPASCTSYTYLNGEDKKVLGNVYTQQVLVSFSYGLSAEKEAEALASYSFVKGIAGQQARTGPLQSLELVEGLSCKEVEQAIKILSEDPAIAYAAPYFLKGDGIMGISDEAIITLEDGSAAAIEQLAAAFDAEVVEELSENTYLLKVDKSSKGNALDLANFMAGQEGIAHAEPNLVMAAN
ncbi:S8 family serine peptidase [Pontibacter ummariensis]|nr:hypothetical protein [Pontibacter ummariensis]